jgi:hypothetical protein
MEPHDVMEPLHFVVGLLLFAAYMTAHLPLPFGVGVYETQSLSIRGMSPWETADECFASCCDRPECPRAFADRETTASGQQTHHG